MRIACIQMEVGDRPKSEHIARAEKLLERVEEADLVLLPEVWNIGYFSFDRYRPESEAPGGETAERMSSMARKLGTYLLAGSWITREEGGKLFNTSFLFDRNGDLVAKYRKIHLFGYGSRETEILEGGKEIVTHRTDFGTIGIATCYDLRFPELFRKMMSMGTEIFLVVSGWPFPRLEPWILFNRVRALENLAFLVSCNCAGVNRGVRFCGHSMIVDPWGKAVAAGGDEEEVITADIDKDMVTRAREEFPALRDIVFPP
ncbi:MAG: carbon-nitrogen family hydrolase [Deltaproteobacteria bacterium]|nr:carbon-nitrogen family hydrolase [Deltaproteobacteria bacterium]MBW2016030.1 carbon-nitrogen family hydrolase [Deltaproteobacteria bacterium]MBW2128327.1 carbon-nitrogen family hydrolase [Deltaproteobacteria bacterium]MBW2302159.1 carbon-nitrogen family hydrolase [Deltaproteobacteria bacterium]